MFALSLEIRLHGHTSGLYIHTNLLSIIKICALLGDMETAVAILGTPCG